MSQVNTVGRRVRVKALHSRALVQDLCVLSYMNQEYPPHVVFFFFNSAGVLRPHHSIFVIHFIYFLQQVLLYFCIMVTRNQCE